MRSTAIKIIPRGIFHILFLEGGWRYVFGQLHFFLMNTLIVFQGFGGFFQVYFSLFFLLSFSRSFQFADYNKPQTQQHLAGSVARSHSPNDQLQAEFIRVNSGVNDRSRDEGHAIFTSLRMNRLKRFGHPHNPATYNDPVKSDVFFFFFK